MCVCVCVCVCIYIYIYIYIYKLRYLLIVPFNTFCWRDDDDGGGGDDDDDDSHTRSETRCHPLIHKISSV